MQVAVSTLDVANLDEAHALIKLADGQAPVGGVFHLAMILSDRFMTNQVQPFRLRLLHASYRSWLCSYKFVLSGNPGLGGESLGIGSSAEDTCTLVRNRSALVRKQDLKEGMLSRGQLKCHLAGKECACLRCKVARAQKGDAFMVWAVCLFGMRSVQGTNHYA